MAMTKSEEAIVESDQEIQRRKRVNNGKDARPTKKAKVEGNKVAELPICDGRNLGDEAEGEAMSLCDDELNRLRRLLVDGSKELSNKDVKGVIRYLKVDEIVRLTLKSGQGKQIYDEDIEEDWIDKNDPYLPCSGKVHVLLRLMLCRIEKVEQADFWLLYQNFPHVAFVPLLLLGLDSYNYRCCGGMPLLTKEERDMLPELCRVLPWKLFAHILSCKTSLCLFKSTNEESGDKCTLVQKKAAENCEICYGKGKHSGFYGHHCSFWDSVPKGATVGPKFWVVCRYCGMINANPVEECDSCGSEEGQAVPIRRFWKN